MIFFELERIYTKRSKEIRAEKKEWLQVVRLIFDLYESHTDLFTHLHYMAKYGEICVFSIWHIIVLMQIDCVFYVNYVRHRPTLS